MSLVTDNGYKVRFRARCTTPFDKLACAFAARAGFSRSHLRFSLDGGLIDESATLADLGLADGGRIEVIMMIRGG